MTQFNFQVGTLPALPRSKTRRERNMSASGAVATSSTSVSPGGDIDMSNYIRTSDLIKTLTSADVIAQLAADAKMDDKVMSYLLTQNKLDAKANAVHDHANQLLRPAVFAIPTAAPDASKFNLITGEEYEYRNATGTYAETPGSISESDLAVYLKKADLMPGDNITITENTTTGKFTIAAKITDYTLTKAAVETVLTGDITSHFHSFDNITSRPTTLDGYGITDANIVNGVVTLGAQSITPLTSHQSIYALTIQYNGSPVGTFTPNSADKTISITGATGTVTLVGLSVPAGFSISGSPVTSSGTLAIAFADGYSLPSLAKQNNWDAVYNWYSGITATDADTVINKWTEIINFLSGISSAETLDSLMSGISTDIATALSSAKGYADSQDAAVKTWVTNNFNNYSLPLATSSVLGGIKIGYSTTGKNYPVQLDTNGRAFVAVPWTDLPSSLKNPYALSWNGGSYDGSAAKSIVIPTTLPASDVSAWAKASSKPAYSYSEITDTPASLKNPYALSWSGYATGNYDGSAAKSIVIPTTLPASDVYAWAKASSKPAYSYSEITGLAGYVSGVVADYLLKSGGTLTGLLTCNAGITANTITVTGDMVCGGLCIPQSAPTSPVSGRIYEYDNPTGTYAQVPTS